MLSKRSIRSKVFAIISLLLATLTGTGLLAITKMQTINGQTVEITRHWLPNVRVLGTIRADINSYRFNLHQFMIEIDPQKKASAEKSIESAGNDIDDGFKAYEALVASSEERVLADDVIHS
jgi:methyl-accepting chemotaxis protein